MRLLAAVETHAHFHRVTVIPVFHSHPLVDLSMLVGEDKKRPTALVQAVGL